MVIQCPLAVSCQAQLQIQGDYKASMYPCDLNSRTRIAVRMNQLPTVERHLLVVLTAFSSVRLQRLGRRIHFLLVHML